jgi:sterol desaturase/sphingolipid hydroxylase (fatty acid hydroxylase superfamily)
VIILLATLDNIWATFDFSSPDFFKAITTGAALFAAQLFSLSIICFILELIQPERYSISIQSRLRGVYYMIIYIWIATFLSYYIYHLTSLADYQPLYFLNLQWFSNSQIWQLNILGVVAASLVSLIIYDFFYYWFHRLQHKIPFLWHFHSIHHSPKELSVWSNYHHFMEAIFRMIFLLIPTTLLIKTTPMPILFVIVLSLQGIFSHAATRFNFGFLRYFILDNRYHRIHHSIEKQHRNKNFASQLPLWDIVFGTEYFPNTDEWPATGLAEQDEAKNTAEYLMRPFFAKT